MSDLVEKVARLICETENVEGFTCTCPDPFEPDWCHGNRAKAQARAVIAAIAEWLNSQVHSLEGLDAMEAAIEEIKKLRAERDRLKADVERLRQALRINMHAYGIAQEATDALEALVAERDQLLIDLEEYRRDVAKLTGERDHLKVVLVRTAASLAAAISLLESVVKDSLTTAAGGKATKMAAPSDKMFRQMLADYNHALGDAREALEAKE